MKKKEKKKNYFISKQIYNTKYNQQYLEKFSKATTKTYNSMYGGKEISFKAVKDNDGKMKFFVYIINYNNNNLIEYDILKNIKNINSNFISYDNNEIGKEIKINKPTSIRTCITNNKNYITSFNDNKIYIIDTSDILKKTENFIDLGENKGPTYIDLYRPDNKDNIYGYTSNYNDNTVSILDLNNNKKIKDIKVGKNPSFVCVAEKKQILFVANYSSNNISCFDLDKSGNTKEIEDIEVGKNPTCIEINSEETKIYITNYGDSTISVFNIENNIIEDSIIKIPNEAKPYSIDFNTTNKIGAILTNKGIYLIDTAKDNNLELVDFSDKESNEMGEITSARYRYYEKNDKKYEYLFIKNNDGKLFRKVITNKENIDQDKFINFEPLYNFL